jgi:hypothetical protein
MLSINTHASQAYVTTGLIVDQYNLSSDLLDNNLHWLTVYCYLQRNNMEVLVEILGFPYEQHSQFDIWI